MSVIIEGLISELLHLLEDETPSPKPKKKAAPSTPEYHYSLAHSGSTPPPEASNPVPAKPHHSQVADTASEKAHPWEQGHHEDAAHKHYVAAMHAADRGEMDLASHHMKRADHHNKRASELGHLNSNNLGKRYIEKHKAAYDAKQADKKTPVHIKASEYAKSLSGSQNTNLKKAELAHRTAAQLARKAGDHELAASHEAHADMISPTKIAGVAKTKDKPAAEPIPVPNADNFPDLRTKPGEVKSRQQREKERAANRDAVEKAARAKAQNLKQGIAAIRAKYGSTDSHGTPDWDIVGGSRQVAAAQQNDPNLYRHPTMSAPKKPNYKPRKSKSYGEAKEADLKPIETTAGTNPELAKVVNAAIQASSMCDQSDDPMYQANAAIMHTLAWETAEAFGDKERAQYHKKMAQKHKKEAKAKCPCH